MLLLLQTMKKYFCLFLFLIVGNQLFAQYGQRFSALNKYKISVGAGTSIYWGSGRLYNIPRSSNPREVTFAYSVAAFKTISDRFEYGIRYTHGDLAGLRFGRTWGEPTIFKTTFDDLSLQSNISLNNNLFLRDEFYTINLITGIGVTYYEAIMKNLNNENIKSSIGKGSSEGGNIPNRQIEAFGTIGIGYHVRISQLLSLGIDNFLNVTTSKSLTGITQTSSVKVYDSYSVHLLTIGLRLGKGNKLFCARL